MMYGFELDGGMWGLGVIFMFFVWVIFILGIVALVRYMTGGQFNNSTDKALQILKERYAKGEISADEYKEGKRLLGY